jgi:hypothetical protein
LKLKSINDLSFIELTLCCDDTDAPHSIDQIALNAEITTADGFSGRCNEIWFQRATIDRFMIELEDFERTRSGSVMLSSSPKSDFNEFQFVLSSLDRGETLFAELNLSKLKYTPSQQLQPFRVSAHVLLDPSILHTMITDFRNLFKVAGD